jgi:hypothetical protein
MKEQTYLLNYKGVTYYLPELTRYGWYAKLRFYLFYVLTGEYKHYVNRDHNEP